MIQLNYFRGVSASEKLAMVSIFNFKGTISKKINVFSLVNTASVKILFENGSFFF